MKKIRTTHFLLLTIFLFSTFSLKANPCDSLDIILETEGVFYGKSTGAIHVTILGGYSNGYLIEWDNTSNKIWESANTSLSSHTIEDLPPGDYIIKVMDSQTRCFVMKKVTLKGNVGPEKLEITANPTNCTGFGSISVHISHEKELVYFTLKGPVSGSYGAKSSNFKIYNLPAGDYELLFKDGDCSAYATATVPVGEGLPVLTTRRVRDDCKAFTGDLEIVAQDGKPGYTLSWTGPTKGHTNFNGSTILENLQTGNYQFTLKDAYNCKAFSSVYIERTVLSVELEATDGICGKNGAMLINIKNGTAPFIIQWNGAGTGETDPLEERQNSLSLPIGTYGINVIDAQGCTISSSATIKEKTSDLYCSISPESTTCNLENGVLDIFISGGKSPYMLSYIGPISGTLTVFGSTKIKNLPSGTYTTILSDAEGCGVSESAEITAREIENTEASFSYSTGGTTVNFFNQSTNGSYLWDFGDGNTSDQISPSHVYQASGDFEVCLTVTGLCNAETECQTLTIQGLTDENEEGIYSRQLTGKHINSKTSVGNLRVQPNFPNPFSQQTLINFELPAAQIVNITLIDQVGRVVKHITRKFDSGNNQL